MAKKLAKLFLFLATVGAAFAGAYYYLKTKSVSPAEEGDYDDLDDDYYEVTDSSSEDRSYVSLTPDTDSEAPAESVDTQAGTTVEEFFDDDDDDDDTSLDAM